MTINPPTQPVQPKKTTPPITLSPGALYSRKTGKGKNMLAKIYRPAVLSLLALLVFVQVVRLAMDIRHTYECKSGAVMISDELAKMSSNYEKDVYNNPQVDNINKQQMMVAEYQLHTQQTISQLLAACQ